MTVVGYIFLDVNRDNLISLAVQQQMLEEYAGEAGLRVDELLVEQLYSLETPFMERDEGKRLLENVQAGDMVFTTRAKWVLGTAQEALLLIGILKEKKVSLFCVDLDGDIVQQAERKLVVSQGIAPLVQKVCEALSVKMESGRHAAAIRESKARQKKAGKYLGGPIPFGFQVDEGGRLQQNTEQQIIIDKMLSMKGDRWSYRDIARKMQEDHGLKFSHEGIRRILLKKKKK
ncbi:MAG: recombinase family protein [Thermodesulfobacteriota bacterium]|nr:recombinase family protein [Thermodesulfobacteriota bacterium]